MLPSEGTRYPSLASYALRLGSSNVGKKGRGKKKNGSGKIQNRMWQKGEDKEIIDSWIAYLMYEVEFLLLAKQPEALPKQPVTERHTAEVSSRAIFFVANQRRRSTGPHNSCSMPVSPARTTAHHQDWKLSLSDIQRNECGTVWCANDAPQRHNTRRQWAPCKIHSSQTEDPRAPRHLLSG